MRLHHGERKNAGAQARAHSADLALNPSRDDVLAEVRKLKEELADVIIDTSANARAVNESFNWIGRSKKYCLQAYYPDETSLDLLQPHVRQTTIINPTGWSPEDQGAALDLLAAGKVTLRPMILDQVPCTEAPALYRKALEAPGELLGVVFEWKT